MDNGSAGDGGKGMDQGKRFEKSSKFGSAKFSTFFKPFSLIHPLPIHDPLCIRIHCEYVYPSIIHHVSLSIILSRLRIHLETTNNKQTTKEQGGRVYVGHILANLLETTVLWVQMAMLKRCALKNDPENRWNFVKWTNGGPNLTRNLGWNWG